MAKKHSGFCSEKSFFFYAIFCFEEQRCGYCLKPILQLKLSTAKIVLFFLLVVTRCVWLVFDELSMKKNMARFAPVQNDFLIYFFITKKTTITELSNLGSLFIFSVLVFKTLKLIPNMALILHDELLKPAFFVNAPLPLLPQS